MSDSTIIIMEAITMSESARFLQSQRDNRVDGKEILSLLLYVSFLTLCFLLPLLLRGSGWDQDVENAASPEEDGPDATTSGQARSADEQPETRAMRKKYRAERRSRIVKAFSPVSLILREEHFYRGQDEQQGGADETQGNRAKVSDVRAMEEGIKPSPKKDAKLPYDDDYDDGSLNNNDDVESGGDISSPQEFVIDIIDNPYYAEETNFVKISSTVVNNADSLSSTTTTRFVPCACVICLGLYKVGEKIVWSSNPSCEHAFHEHCIEKWLMKQQQQQQEGGLLLCPCCRRNFIMDPF